LLSRSLMSAASFAATMILLYVLLASEHWMLSRFMETLTKRRSRALVLGGLRAAQRDIGRYLAALSVVNLAVGTATGLAAAVLGLPNPLLWAVVAGVFNFVPYIGPLVVAVMLLLAGMASFNELSDMLAPALCFALIHWLDSMLANPWLVGRRLALSTLSVFLSVMFWGWLWGIPGALIAVPALIGLRTVCRRVPQLRLLGAYLQGDSLPCPSSPSLLRATRRSAVYR
jgi:predicted PurR-regulated permease PerM